MALGFIMGDSKVKKYMIDTIMLLKKQGLDAKKDADRSKEGAEEYKRGEVMACVRSFLRRKIKPLYSA